MEALQFTLYVGCSISRVGFLLCQRYFAALYLWRFLLCAGDVERNPGPPGMGLCVRCGRTTSGRGPSCSGCGGKIHLSCSGFPRGRFYRLEEVGGWRCGNCEGVEGWRTTVERRIPPVDVSVGRRECGVCGAALRQGTTGVRCMRCEVVAHATCTGMSDRARARGDGWWCSSCRTMEERRRGEETTRLPGGACDECGRTRRPGQGVQCRSCKCLVHKKCAGVGSRVGLSHM